MQCNILSIWRLRRFTEDHARVSQTGSENISSCNRPSTLEGKYKEFYDHERIDAINCIESSRIKKERTNWTEVEDQLVACDIFEVNNTQDGALPSTERDFGVFSRYCFSIKNFIVNRVGTEHA